MVRVCPIRVCQTRDSQADHEEVIGAYSPGTTLTTQRPVALQTKELAETSAQEPVLQARLQQLVTAIKPETEKQYAMIIVVLLFILSVFLAGIAHYFIG